MNRTRWTSKGTMGCLALALLVGCGTSRTDALDADRRAAIVSEVEAFLTGYRQAFNAGNPEALADLYVTDDRFAIYEDGTLRYASPRSVVEAVAGFPPGMSMTTEGDVTDVTPLTQDLAMADTSYRTRITMPDGGEFAVHGVMTAVLERSAEGWRIVRAHTSSVRERRGS